MSERVAAVIGIGPGNGEAITRKLAGNGYRVAMLTRTKSKLDDYEAEIDGTQGFECDVSDKASLEGALKAVATELGPIDVMVYNAGSGVWGGLDEVEPDDFEASWRVNCFGLFLAAQNVVPGMAERGTGAVIVIGAGAAWRGRAGSIAFAQSKAAQRSTAQSLARQYGPKGVHVAYVVIDGVIDLPRTREWMSDKPDEFFLQPDDIAVTVQHLIDQPRSAWSFEVDVRPYVEDW
jgi:NAD(P)-dependent dehydrogenase (short-subunit alcohol dehydrogenase family)